MRPDVRKIVLDSIAGLPEPTQWWWCSFADPHKPAGSQFLGIAIVRAHNIGHASMICHQRHCNPGGELMATPVPEAFGPPPPEWDHKLISDLATINRLTNVWHGCDVVRANGEDVEVPGAATLLDE